MSWNYRVVRENSPYSQYRIVEMYHNAQGAPENYCEPFYEQDTLEDLKWVLDTMQEALKKPVILLDSQGKILRD